MHLQAHPFSIPFLIASLIAGLIIAAIWPRRVTPGAKSLMIHMLGLVLWNGATAAMWLHTTLDAQEFWLKVSAFGVVLSPAAFLIFSVKISFNEKWLKRRWLAFLAIEPIVGIILVWTNDVHHLVYSGLELWIVNGLAEIRWQPEFWFYLDTAYMCLVYMLAIIFLAQAFPRHGTLYRQQASILLGGALLPLFSLLLSFVPSSRLNTNLDLSPLFFTISGGAYFYAISKRKFLDLIPVAHSVLLHSMPDGVVVIDAHDRIVDMNRAAGEFLGVIPRQVTGRYAKEILASWRETTQPLWGQAELHTEIQVVGNVPRTIDLKITPLLDKLNRPLGRMLVFRDITLRKQHEFMLKEKNLQLNEQLEEIRALRDQLREQAIRDPLTNLYNRRYLEETFERELARAARENYPVCVIMMDIDRFKLVNDTCGHKVGDEVLQSLATLIVLHIRRFDVACRYGGEEFVIVMPMLSTDTAWERAEFLRREFSAMPLPCGAMTKGPTLSIGIASYPADGISGEQLLNAADQALYSAKGSGRNRTILYSSLTDKEKKAEKTPFNSKTW